MLDDRNRQMRPIVDQPRDIVLGHFGQLLLEDALQPRKDDKTIMGTIVVDHPELDIASTFFQHGRLSWK